MQSGVIPQTFDTAFDHVKGLVADFKENERIFLDPSYSEANVRKDFIDKFWWALGWDVNHDYQKNPYEQDVKVEHNVNDKGRGTKADYAFLAPNFRDVRFFVEAKKPARSIDNPDDYFQTLRYGWNAGAPLSVLTDFEHFRLLDCRYKPDVYAALQRAVKKFHFTEYADEAKFGEIYFLLSRQAVTGGAFEKFVEALEKPAGRAAQRKLFGGAHKSVDEDFLQQLDELRDELARSFKNRNAHLNGDDLTEATQRTLDRLVFMRFLEDKLIEPEPIVERLGERGTAWGEFVSESRRLDRIYNGIIFKHHAIIDDAGFVVDEHVFTGVRERLAHTNTSYNFNYIPIHVLGSIYERFLGKVIVTTDKRAKVVDKPAVRKAGGVYYTPEYIVRYIVGQTIGKLIEGKTPEEIALMRFADMACGSGSFLLGIYDELLRYHTAYYNDPRNQKKALKEGCIETPDKSLRLSLNQRKDILLNNIYGVDLDAQAVEVAQLSLFLKLLEEETTASAKGYQLQFRETMLPSLDKNIVCGNSLIDGNISYGKLFDNGEERRLNPMSYEAVFPQVMREGGFDAILGNPPYLFITELNQIEKDYFSREYQTYSYRYDIYGLFIEKAIKGLLKVKGQLGFITPHTLLNNDSFEKLRLFLLERTRLNSIVDIGPGVFQHAKNETMLLFASNEQTRNGHKCHVIKSDKRLTNLDKGQWVKQDLFAELPKSAFVVSTDAASLALTKKLRAISTKLGGFCTINQGLRTGNNERYLSERRTLPTHRKAVGGKNVSRYFAQSDFFVQYEPDRLDAPRSESIFTSDEKIVVQEIRNITLKRRIVAAYDDQQLYCLQSTNVINLRPDVSLNIKYLLGLLNSSLLNWFFRVSFPSNNHIASNQLAQLPIRTINFSDKADHARHDKMVIFVEQMLAAKGQLQQARTDRDRNFYENKCAMLDRQIDKLVYELYGLTGEEIKVIENGHL